VGELLSSLERASDASEWNLGLLVQLEGGCSQVLSHAKNEMTALSALKYIAILNPLMTIWLRWRPRIIGPDPYGLVKTKVMNPRPNELAVARIA